MRLELVLDARATIGESPLWVPPENALYWADIKAPALHRLHLGSGETKTWRVPADLGGFALDGHGRALVALRTGIGWLDLVSGEFSQIVAAPFDPKLIRFNESIVDSQGRFWVGVMTDPLGDRPGDDIAMLYSFTERDGLKAHMDFTYLTNGMAFSADEKAFFLSHSVERKIYSFDYDKVAGRIGARREFASLGNIKGLPDGAAMDAQSHYWCAVHGEWKLHRYNPQGRLVEVIALPVSQPTMCCFAGDDLSDLYVTSAREKLSPEDLEKEPQAGGLFRLRPGVRGQPKNWRFG